MTAQSIEFESIDVHNDPLVLRAAARYTRQFSEPQLRSVFRNRDRNVASLAFHVFRVAEMGLQAAQQGALVAQRL